MYVSKFEEFSDAQAVTATAISTNVIDLFTTNVGAGSNITPNTRLDVGSGEGVWFVVQVPVQITDAGSDATLQIDLVTADDAALSTNAQTVYSTGVMPFATFSSAGTKLVAVRLPNFAYRRYLGVKYTVASGPFTAGAIDAFLTYDAVDAQRYYKSGFKVQ